MNMNMKEHLNLLGRVVHDYVTGCDGVVEKVGFDLYGRIQVFVLLAHTKGGVIEASYWCDISRIEAVSTMPVIPQPDFASIPVVGLQE